MTHRSRPGLDDASTATLHDVATRPSLAGLGPQTALLTYAMAITPMIQYSLGVLAPFLVREGLTRTGLGTVVSLIFVTAAVTAPVAGRLVDVMGAGRVLNLLFGGAALAAGIFAMSTSIMAMSVAGVVAGLALGCANPTTNVLVRDLIEPRERPLVIGVKQSGVKVAQIVTGLALPAIALVASWRWAATTIVAVAMAGLVLKRHALRGWRPRERATKTTAQAVLPSGLLPRLMAFGLFMGMGQGALSTYLPLYAFEELDVSIALAGAFGSLLGVLGVVSRIGWARRANPELPASRSLVGIALGSVIGTLLLLVSDRAGVAVAVLGVAIVGLTTPIWMVAATLSIVRDVDGARTGRASGRLFLAFSSGLMIGPAGFGILVDRTGSYTPAWLTTVATFACCLAGAIVLRRWEARVEIPNPDTVGSRGAVRRARTPQGSWTGPGSDL